MLGRWDGLCSWRARATALTTPMRCVRGGPPRCWKVHGQSGPPTLGDPSCAASGEGPCPPELDRVSHGICWPGPMRAVRGGTRRRAVHH